MVWPNESVETFDFFAYAEVVISIGDEIFNVGGEIIPSHAGDEKHIDGSKIILF